MVAINIKKYLKKIVKKHYKNIKLKFVENICAP